MKKVVEFLQANPVQYLATVGRDGKAKCRPFMFCFEQDGKLWFCTNNTKDVYKDILANPEIEVSVSSPEYAWIRLHGKAVFENNMSVKEGCMKFYAFNDDGGDTLNLLLDHNTTAKVFWNFDESNANGPKQILGQLKTDTSNWKGTNTPTNYTMDQTDQPSGANYTIDYSDYKARLITAQEIATITGYTDWNEWYYFLESKTTSPSSTCKNGNTSGCKYGWLYDRTGTNCTTYGCLNNSDKSTSGYWTISSRAGDTKSALNMYYHAFLYFTDVNTSNYVGVRPVITVLKSKLS